MLHCWTGRMLIGRPPSRTSPTLDTEIEWIDDVSVGHVRKRAPGCGIGRASSSKIRNGHPPDGNGREAIRL